MTETSSPADTRRMQIVQQATQIFLRYGHARTTMGDIAKAAGLSRPTLYLSFPDKDAIFRAVVETMVESAMKRLQGIAAGPDELGIKLQVICESWTFEGFDLVKSHPDARDMFDLGFAVVRESYARFDVLLAELLAPAADRLPGGASPEVLAQTISAALKGFKDLATDRDMLGRMIRCLTDTVAASVMK